MKLAAAPVWLGMTMNPPHDHDPRLDLLIAAASCVEAAQAVLATIQTNGEFYACALLDCATALLTKAPETPDQAESLELVLELRRSLSDSPLN